MNGITHSFSAANEYGSDPDVSGPGSGAGQGASQAPQCWTVTEVNAMLRDLIEGSLLPLRVTGEVGNLTIHRSGHVYLTLKDASSQIRAVFFGGAALCRSLNLCEGMKIEADGKLAVYAARGEYQLNLRNLRLFGIGELQQKFEELKQRLAGEGLFDQARKKPIPFLPARIGVISSPSGAALQDFLRIALARFPELEIKVCPAPVQGKGAESRLARAIRFFNKIRTVDVIVLTRGGGSLEDLWAFNEEELARAIAASTIPVVSAVGHEIDFTISDFVADMRAPTPSGAAELLIPEKSVILDRLEHCRRRLEGVTRAAADRAQARLDHANRSWVFRDLDHLVMDRMQTLDLMMDDARGLLQQAWEHAGTRVVQADRSIQALDPYQVLNRGYAILMDKHGHAVTSAKNIETGSKLQAKLADGELSVTVDETKPSDPGR